MDLTLDDFTIDDLVNSIDDDTVNSVIPDSDDSDSTISDKRAYLGSILQELFDKDPDDITSYVTRIDVNDDGDTDVESYDTDGDGEDDTAIVTADNKQEADDANEEAEDELTSTGQNKHILSDENKKNKHPADCNCAECKKQKTVSDMRQKNIISALAGIMY